MCAQQIWIIVWDKHADRKRPQDVEEEDTPEDPANCFWDVLSRVFCLAGGNGNHLDTTVRECGIDEGGEETEETSSVTCADIFLHRAGIFPVTESNPVMGRAAAKIKAQRHEEETNDRDNLDAGKNEFCFSIDGYGEYVETDDDNDDYRYPSCNVDANSAIPELNDERSCRDFGAKGDGGGVPILNKSGNRGTLTYSSNPTYVPPDRKA